MSEITDNPISEVNYNNKSIPVKSVNGLPAGGTTDQILAKASDADYDTKWVDAPSGGGEKLYCHTLYIKNNDDNCLIRAQIISKSSTMFTTATFLQYLLDNKHKEYSNSLMANGYLQNTTEIVEIYGLSSKSTMVLTLHKMVKSFNIVDNAINITYTKGTETLAIQELTIYGIVHEIV